MVRRGGLGTNLDALIPTTLSVGGIDVAQQNEVPIDAISPNPRQPRKSFNEESLNELIASIKEIGILQPPVVREKSLGKYELVIGERRYRAAKAAGLKSIHVIIRQTPDNELLRDALIENIHRSELNAIEEASAYQQLLSDFACTHDELAAKLGRSRPLISNTMRLMNLPISVQSKVIAGSISAGHARALLGLNDQATIENLANRIIIEGLSVRAIERIISQGIVGVAKKKTVSKKKSTTPELNEIGEEIGDALETRVSIEGGEKGGKIIVEFANIEDLVRIKKIIIELKLLRHDDQFPA